MVISVDELIQKPFFCRNHAEKVQIVAEGKPRPPLGLNFLENKLGENSPVLFMTIFDTDMYDKIDWLTACNKRESVFCWPCLLSSHENIRWRTEGYRDFAHLPESIKDHEKSVTHMQSILDLQTFCRQNMLQNSAHASLVNNDIRLMVQRNRNIMKRIIDAVCLLITQQRPPNVGSKDKNELRIGDCLENLELIRAYDTQGANMLEDAIEVLQISPNILSDLVDVMTTLLKSSIRKETKSSTFVSLILNGHSFDGVKCQISSVLRYLNDGKVCERFVGFTNLEVSQNDENVWKHILKITAEYEICAKIIAISFDGAVLQDKNAIDYFLKGLPAYYPYALFVPCYFHKFDEVLQQSLTIYDDCDRFFKTARAICHFLCRDLKTRQHFENFMHDKAPISDILNFVSYAVFYTQLKTLRRYLIEYFDYTMRTCENWKAEDLTKVLGFRLFLDEFKTIFLLNMFVRLFNFTSAFCSTLGSEMPEDALGNNWIDYILRYLDSEKKSGFDDLWKNVVNFEIVESLRVVVEMDRNIQNVCRSLFIYSITSIAIQIRNRFKYSTELEFFHILNPTKYEKCTKTRDFLLKLKDFCGNTFDVPQMRKELKVLNANPDLIANKSVYELIEFFIESDLKADFKNVYKLAEMILTMPCKPPSLKDCSSKLDKINPWFYSSDENEFWDEKKGDLSVLCVEIDNLLQLKNQDTFYDEIILKFQERNNSMELLSM